MIRQFQQIGWTYSFILYVSLGNWRAWVSEKEQFATRELELRRSAIN
ncbi:hypothetical protein B4123_1564 [Bacillus paralicheniformis]|uniref:Uncharacterized protein n=1 Tax=Bacillus paralicheniformis TaxID=1648923 RepID=A0ABY3FTE9_9BACI|nr:hypothetical protein [Bacillus paralicheniformis]OLG11960.1 hypothetical protein B4123_1564 [Bacillus paralicheniformis]TWJ57161.1 hypothetical protein CHCC5023_1437 [Bacillus paralicheniformis]TWJ62161.1 hypothetical protein CHCC5021_1628 [Bacillus paralicheniformis]TWJ69934.1 hypothetical protein CHCC5019_2459 [Bacillus paralicheniformis]